MVLLLFAPGSRLFATPQAPLLSVPDTGPWECLPLGGVPAKCGSTFRWDARLFAARAAILPCACPAFARHTNSWRHDRAWSRADEWFSFGRRLPCRDGQGH